MTVLKNSFNRRSVEQERSVTALAAVFSDKIFNNFETFLINNNFGFDTFTFTHKLCINVFTHKLCINVFATQKMWSKCDNLTPA